MASNAYGREPSRREGTFDQEESWQPSHAAGPQPSGGSPTESPAAAGHTVSVLGPSLVFTGKLVAEEDLLIQGRVEGSIRHNAANLTIGTHGVVKADIVAQKVIILGAVQGDVRASDTIVVEASARVQGNLFAPRIGLKEGAKFKGVIDMDAAGEAAPRAGRKQGGSAARTNVGAGSAEARELHNDGKVAEVLESDGE
jgi:cytoskeletal protein CcmA (bactofilin family)